MGSHVKVIRVIQAGVSHMIVWYHRAGIESSFD
jgi:hypothetical protein